MKTEITVLSGDKIITDIQTTRDLCTALMETPHYKKMGPEGIYAIVEKARSIGINPLDALNGGMYFVQGKVELTSAMMNQLIRSAGHSITKDKRSDTTECILHGKRCDNGDTWSESFSIDEAKNAGIYRNQWLKYPKDMLFARALSRLARQLFPDVIKGCYVQGEISETAVSEIQPTPPQVESCVEIISDEEWSELDHWLGNNTTLRENVTNFIMKKWGIGSLSKMPREIYQHVLTRAKQHYVENDQSCGEKLQMTQ